MKVFANHKHASGLENLLWVNTVDFEEQLDGVCNVSIYRQADFRSSRSSGIWFEILEKHGAAPRLTTPSPVAPDDSTGRREFAVFD